MYKGRCLLLVLFIMILLIGCDSDDNLPIYGEYTMDELIYHSSLNITSYEQRKEQLEETQFVIKEDQFQIITTEDTFELNAPTYVTKKMDEDLVEAFQTATSKLITLTDYKYKYQYDVYDNKSETDYRLYLLDDELWLASYTTTTEGTEVILDLFRLK